MPEAAMTPDQSGNDSVRPSLTLDDAENIDFYDPSEDTNEAGNDQQSGNETDETANGQESEEIEATADGDDETPAEESGEEAASTPEPGDDVSVTVNGEKLTLNELKRGYLREGDYTRKTQVVSKKERDLDALSARVTKSVDAIATFLSKQIPEAPDPSLAMTNPGEFVQKKALHDAAMGQVNALLAQAGEVKEVENTLTDQKRKDLLAEENAKLVEAFPITATDEGRKKFFEKAASAARELGYSDEEINSTIDHRMFALAHYAALGKAAEQAKAKAAKKVENAPPVAGQRRQQGANASKARANQEAVKRLRKTGSIDDAMSIDFD